jgi:hypothetical protein
MAKTPPKTVGKEAIQENNPPIDTENGLVKDKDLVMVAGISGAALLLLVLFGYAVRSSGLLDFPSLDGLGNSEDKMQAYYDSALVMRERRLALALTLRTFLTGFSFIVGLALSTIGGIFILRQVKSLTTIGVGPKPGARGKSADEPVGVMAEAMQQFQFSLRAYSPGVVFMLAGLVLMIATQIYAIPIRAVEVMPPNAATICLGTELKTMDACWRDATVSDTVEVATPTQDVTENTPPPKGLGELQTAIEGK